MAGRYFMVERGFMMREGYFRQLFFTVTLCHGRIHGSLSSR